MPRRDRKKETQIKKEDKSEAPQSNYATQAKIWLSILFVPLSLWIIFKLMGFWIVLFGPPVLLLEIWLVLAPQDLFFGFLEEGQGLTSTTGEAFYRAVIRWEGHKFRGHEAQPSTGTAQATVLVAHDPADHWDIVPDPDWDNWSKRIRRIFGGLCWIGIYPFQKRRWYHFRWIGYDQHTKKPVYHDEWLKSFLVYDDRYVLESKGAPDKEMKLVNTLWMLVLGIQNPYKAFFRIRNWLGTVYDSSEGVLRKLEGTMKYEEMASKMKAFNGRASDTLTLDPYDGVILDIQGNEVQLNTEDSFVEVILEYYGIKASNIQLMELSLEEDVKPGSLPDIITTQFKKRKQADGDVEISKGQAKAMKNVTAAMKDRMKELLVEAESHGSLGSLYILIQGLQDNQFEASFVASNMGASVQGLIQQATGQTINAGMTREQIIAIMREALQSQQQTQ